MKLGSTSYTSISGLQPGLGTLFSIFQALRSFFFHAAILFKGSFCSSGKFILLTSTSIPSIPFSSSSLFRLISIVPSFPLSFSSSGLKTSLFCRYCLARSLISLSMASELIWSFISSSIVGICCHPYLSFIKCFLVIFPKINLMQLEGNLLGSGSSFQGCLRYINSYFRSCL